MILEVHMACVVVIVCTPRVLLLRFLVFFVFFYLASYVQTPSLSAVDAPKHVTTTHRTLSVACYRKLDLLLVDHPGLQSGTPLLRHGLSTPCPDS